MNEIVVFKTEKKQGGNVVPEIKKALEYMQASIDQPVSIESLAQKLGYSKFHFCRVFKKHLGISPIEYRASLRIEKSYLTLSQSKSILSAQLKSGYLSSGTFSNTFSKMTGLTPKQFQNQIQNLDYYHQMKSYEDSDQAIFTYHSFDNKRIETQQKNHCVIHIETPSDFRGIIFVGLFKQPIPNQVPILGKALIKKRTCIVDNIPDGQYYLLACAIKSSMNPLDYFYLDDCLRELIRVPITFPLSATTTHTLKLRPKKICDPPIPINPVKLLIEVLRNS